MSNIFSNKGSSKPLTTEHDLHIDDNRVIRNNVSEFWWDYVWDGTFPKTFTTPLPAVSIDRAYLNGEIMIKFKDYRLITTDTIEIIKDIPVNSNVKIEFSHFVVQPIE